GISSDILKCVGEDKKYMRECILNAVVSWLADIHPDRMEQIQDLENDVMRYFGEDLHGSLLSADLKNHGQKALPSMGREIVEVLDILFRWIALRFCESNTSCLLKVDPSTILGPSHGTTIVWIRSSPTELLLVAVDSRGTRKDR
ncbi:Protein MOR1, partial [Striga hermonthica]